MILFTVKETKYIQCNLFSAKMILLLLVTELLGHVQLRTLKKRVDVVLNDML